MKDFTGEVAIQLLTVAYFRERCAALPERRRLDDLREAIELARGWRKP